MNPGALTGAPGFHTVMKNNTASERAAELVREAVDVLLRTENAPDSPVNIFFVTAKMRRELRRNARRLRQQKAEPRYKNLHSAEQLAVIYERTAQRDEIIEQGARDFKRITRDLGRVLEENAPEVRRVFATLVMEARRLAEEQGPGSQAALRYRCFESLAWFGQLAHDHRRNPRAPFPLKIPLARDPSIQARYELTAAMILDSPPPDEAVIAIPPEGKDSGRERAFLRIGFGKASWIGSFELGHMSVGTVSLMPDHKHLFVSAKGAGYIIDLKSRTLVETIGTHVAGVTSDEPRTLFLVDHNGMSLEAFGPSGRLWKTDTISSGGFRGMTLTDTTIEGEAQRAFGWIAFSVDLATGEVWFDDGR